MLEEMGAALYGGPYLASAVLAATALLASTDEQARRDLLPGIAAGDTIATLAFTEDDGRGIRRDPAVGRAGWGGLEAGRAQELRARRRHGLLILVVAATTTGCRCSRWTGTRPG